MIHQSKDPHKFGDKAELKIVQRTKELIEKGWCQGAFAKGPAKNTYRGISSFYNPDEPGATHFCLLGRLRRAGHENNIPYYSLTGCSIPFYNIYLAFMAKYPGKTIEIWNDMPGITKEEVLKVLDQLIEFYKDYES